MEAVMGGWVRSLFAALGAVAALGWAVLFVRAPGAAMELLILCSPVAVAAWLIVTLPSHSRARVSGDAPAAADGQADQLDRIRDAVLARDGGRCELCGESAAHAILARRPPRRGEPDSSARFIAVCAGCHAASALASPTGIAKR
jgi:hypothetical protein